MLLPMPGCRRHDLVLSCKLGAIKSRVGRGNQLVGAKTVAGKAAAPLPDSPEIARQAGGRIGRFRDEGVFRPSGSLVSTGLTGIGCPKHAVLSAVLPRRRLPRTSPTTAPREMSSPVAKVRINPTNARRRERDPCPVLQRFIRIMALRLLAPLWVGSKARGGRAASCFMLAVAHCTGM